jgi:hypothetical protein
MSVSTSSGIVDLPSMWGPMFYASGRHYFAVGPGLGTSGTNVTPLAVDTIQGVLVNIYATVNISAINVRTSSSNASDGAQVRAGIYSVTNKLLPNALIAGRADAVSVGDSAVNSTIVVSLDQTTTLSPGVYFFAIQHGASTTGARFNTYSAPGSQAYGNYLFGATNGFGSLTNGGVCGYTAAATFASGLPSTISSPTAVTDLQTTLVPPISFTVA